jgi:phosphatidate cytidylyltransferase
MFLPRLMTSLILVPLVLFIIFFSNPWLLRAIVFFIFLISGVECFQLIPLKSIGMKISFLIILLLGLWISGLLFSYWLVLGLILWALNILAILSFPRSQAYWGYPVVVAVVCFILLPLFIQSLNHLYYLPNKGKELLVYLLFLIWASDIGAYLSGKLIGKHKLISQVSPGKSWEGVLGGVLLAMGVAVLGAFYFDPENKLYWFVLALYTVIISIFGDLFISILKRRCHLKDTGNLIPGHGGMLDRLDSLIAALPFFYFGLTFR